MSSCASNCCKSTHTQATAHCSFSNPRVLRDRLRFNPIMFVVSASIPLNTMTCQIIKNEWVDFLNYYFKVIIKVNTWVWFSPWKDVVFNVFL